MTTRRSKQKSENKLNGKKREREEHQLDKPICEAIKTRSVQQAVYLAKREKKEIWKLLGLILEL